MQTDQLLNLAVSLLSSASLFVIISLGLAVAFGMMGVINLAHGEFLMLGAYFTLTGVHLGLNVWLSMAVATVAVGAIGMVVERLLLRHLYGRLAATMLATWGLSLLIVGIVQLIFGNATDGIPTPLGSISVGDYNFSQYSLLMIVAAFVMVGITYVVLTRTHYGTMARAAAMRPTMASAVGIDVRRTNMLTFGVAAALAGAGGALLTPVSGIAPTMGQGYIGRAFMTVVVGGPSALSGTTSSAFLLGGVNSVVSNLFTPVLGTVALLLLSIIVLRFLPTGLAGIWKKERH